MRLRLKIVLACCLLAAGCNRSCDGGNTGNNQNNANAPATPTPGGDIGSQVPGRDLREDPPAVESVTARPLPNPSAEGNALVLVRFAREERLPTQLTLDLEERQLTLRDDGQGGDERAGDGTFSAVMSLDLAALQKSNGERVSRAADAAVPVFVNRSLVREDRASSFFERFKRTDSVDLAPVGLPSAVDVGRSLMITDPKVVQDPTRTRTACTGDGSESMGKWSFGYLMEQMANEAATSITPSEFTLKWLDQWLSAQTINGWSVAARAQMKNKVIDPWVAASGGPGKALDLKKAPFRLLAIVNRVDLRQNLAYGAGNAGEARFVFGVMEGPECSQMRFTVIFEYGINKPGCKALRAWAKQWKDLDAHPIGSPEYNDALEKITEQFVKAGSAPSKPNGSALNQLRTNELALDVSPWELREFQLPRGGNGHLQEVTVKQTPDLSLNRTPTLVSYVDANAADIIAQKHRVPENFGGAHFLGGSALTPGGMFWDDPASPPPITDRQARHMFSLQTCNGCHARETNTNFTHVAPASFGTGAAGLSGVLTGINVPDPSDSIPTRNFSDLKRRAADLDALVSTPCIALIKDARLRMVH